MANAKANNTTPTPDIQKVVTTPHRRNTIPSAMTAGQYVGLGIASGRGECHPGRMFAARLGASWSRTGDVLLSLSFIGLFIGFYFMRKALDMACGNRFTVPTV